MYVFYCLYLRLQVQRLSRKMATQQKHPLLHFNTEPSPYQKHRCLVISVLLSVSLSSYPLLCTDCVVLQQLLLLPSERGSPYTPPLTAYCCQLRLPNQQQHKKRNRLDGFTHTLYFISGLSVRPLWRCSGIKMRSQFLTFLHPLRVESAQISN